MQISQIMIDISWISKLIIGYRKIILDNPSIRYRLPQLSINHPQFIRWVQFGIPIQLPYVWYKHFSIGAHVYQMGYHLLISIGFKPSPVPVVRARFDSKKAILQVTWRFGWNEKSEGLEPQENRRKTVAGTIRKPIDYINVMVSGKIDTAPNV